MTGFVVRINPSCSSNAGVFVEAYVSEDLAVNQCWDVRSDVYLCLSASSASKSNWIYFGCLFLSK